MIVSRTTETQVSGPDLQLLWGLLHLQFQQDWRNKSHLKSPPPSLQMLCSLRFPDTPQKAEGDTQHFTQTFYACCNRKKNKGIPSRTCLLRSDDSVPCVKPWLTPHCCKLGFFTSHKTYCVVGPSFLFRVIEMKLNLFLSANLVE